MSLLEVLYEQSEKGGGPASVQPQPGQPSDVDRFLSLVRARIEEDYPPDVTAHVDRKLDEVTGITARFGDGPVSGNGPCVAKRGGPEEGN